LGGMGIRCFFGIDGLADTNHVYRRGTSWERIIANAKTFITSGGYAEWDFLVFQHNEHQLEEARDLSKALGFRRFNIKATARFFSNGVMNSSYPVMDGGGTIEYYLRPAVAIDLRNRGIDHLSDASRSNEDYEHYLATTPIVCKAVQWRSIYISAEGLVLPCYWMGLLYNRPGESGGTEINRLVEQCQDGRGAINAKLRPIKEIVEDRLFQTLIPQRWEPSSTNRLRVCAKICGHCDIRATQRLPETEINYQHS
jgi:hypothetical protein